MALVCCLLMSLHANAYNKLSIPDVLMERGGSVDLPVNLENDDQIVALQFTLTVPDGFTLDVNSAQLTERSSGHLLRVKNVQGNDYLCMVYSVDNTEIIGNKGTVMRVTLTAPNSVNGGDVFPMTISDAVASDANMNNLLSESSAGTITFTDYPDLVPGNVTTDKQQYAPGDHILVSWTVQNIGQLSTGGGWSEQISLVDENGTICMLGTTYHNGILGAGGSVSQQAEIVIPPVPGIHGNVVPQVRIIPNSDSGERPEAQGNNTIQGPWVQLDAMLYLDLSKYAVEETYSRPLTAVVTRSGNREEALTVTLTSNDSRVSLPPTASIAAGQSSVSIPVTLIDNDVVDDGDKAIITANASGYPRVDAVLTIEDNEFPQLTIAASKREMTEGETNELTVTIPRARQDDVTVNITCNASARFETISDVVIPAGETSATIVIMSIDDNDPALDQEVTFVASSSGFESDEAWVTLHDNDIPTMDLVLTPTTVSESAGPNAIIAKLRRLDHTDTHITVYLSDDSQGGLTYPQPVTMTENITEVEFTIGVKDNLIVDGDRNINVTAAIYIKSCSCQAHGGSAGSVTRQITVTDNDGPAVTITSSRSTIAEGNEATLTITRNADFDQPLTVTLTGNNDTDLEYAHEVTIPAGQQSVNITIKALNNDVADDDHLVTITAQANGFSSSTCWIMISNQTLPDAIVSAISLSASEVEVGSDIDVTVTITNTGSLDLPSQTKTAVYLNSSQQVVMYNQTTLAPGESATMTKTITMPTQVGTYQIYAVVNPDHKVKELVTSNNTSERVSVTLLAPFSATLTTDKDVYEPGETIVFSGTVSGNVAEGTEVEVYYICNGLRRTLTATTDANGNFSVELQPYTGDMGHFVAGACYPSENLSASQAEFDLVGLRRTSNSYITCDMLLNEPYHASISLFNPTTVPLHNVRVNVLSQPDNYNLSFTNITEMEGGTTGTIEIEIVGTSISTQSNWDLAQLEIISDEGARTTTTLYLYCRNPLGQLKADITSINTTMTKGQSRNYPFYITNIGKANTGMISLALPNWMKSATPSQMPGIEPGDSTMIILTFMPTEDMQLNVTRTGHIGINCENGNGISLPFRIEPVSESTGTIIIDVCDEFTYNTAEAPHVQGAHVVIKHPTTGAIITEGYTGENGKFIATLPEGYYALRVSAERHESYANYMLVDPGIEKLKVINLSFQAVTVNWTVVETEIEDHYDIVTTYTYETNVPRPVVVISGPEGVNGEEMAVGESKLLYFTLTNVGLIQAEDVIFALPETNGEWEMQALAYTEPFTLAANQSVVVPVILTRLAEEPTLSYKSYASDYMARFDECMAKLAALYKWLCGKDLKDDAALYHLAVKFCGLTSLIGPGSGGSGGGGIGWPWWPPCPNCGGSVGGGGSDIPEIVDPPYHVDVDSESPFCNPLFTQCFADVLNLAISTIPVVGQLNTIADILIDATNGEMPDLTDLGGLLAEAGEKITSGSVSSTLEGIAEDFSVIGIITTIYDCIKAAIFSKNINQASSGIDWVDEFCFNGEQYVDQYNHMIGILYEITGDSVWFNGDDETLLLFWKKVATLDRDDFTFENLLEYKPESVSEEQLALLIDRIRNTHAGSTAENRINTDSLRYHYEEYMKYDALAQENGFETMSDMMNASINTIQENLKQEESSVCSKITLQISQHLVMTRQAFRGTLTVYNGHDSEPIRDAKLTLVVTDEEGNIATRHEFEIAPESLKGFQGGLSLDAGWTLGADETGIATILFIPTKYAAPIEDKVYLFGGSFSYIDPFTGLLVTRELTPERLTVRPSPNLILDYFMQRDIFGDDPLTEEVEPMQDAEFALIIDNQGYGAANNVRMTTHQPEIIENEKGLLIDFEFVSSQLNGQDAVLAMDDDIFTDFGTIPAHSQAYAQWWLRSTLLGHFLTYDVSYNHVTSYGNEDLSLLDTVRVHELIHGFTTDDVTGNRIRGFLVNDMPDAEDKPDIIHFTNAMQEGVAMSSATISRISDTEYLLKVTAGGPDWNYGSVIDPTLGRQKIVRVVRQSDGKTIYADNVWATDRTLIDGADWLYENRLHYVVEMTGMTDNYLISFEPKPDLELAVESFEGLPAAGVYNSEPVTQLIVNFNKPVDATTFTTEDITLTCEGKPLDASLIGITPLSDTSFELDLSQVTYANGYYVLTVQTAGIKDTEGFNGSTGKQATWTQYMSGVAHLEVLVDPDGAGLAVPGSGDYPVNSTIHMRAMAEPGYTFMSWMSDEETISNEPEFDYQHLGDAHLTAVFYRTTCSVEIILNDEHGTITGGNSQICDYGTVLELKAEPAEDYEFCYWLVNGQFYSDNPELTITVVEDMTIEAVFKETESLDITLPPVLSYDKETLTLTAQGEGEIHVYVDGNEVQVPYTFEQTEQEVTYVVTATAQEAGKEISETAELIVTVPAKEVVPEVTAAPEINYDPETFTVTVEGNGEIHVYVDGNEVQVPYTFEQTEEEVTYVVTATAQEAGKEISETAELIVTVPAKEVVPEVTATPEIVVTETDDAIIINVVGEGEIHVYVDGNEVQVPCTIEKGEEPRDIVITATAQADDKEISETATREVTIPAKEVVPEVTATPVINYDPETFTVTVEGNGEIHVYVDGNEVQVPYTFEQTEEEVTYVVTATAQEAGKEISETATREITVPAKEVEPEDPHATGYWLVTIDKDGNEVWEPMAIGDDEDGHQTSIALTYKDYGTFDWQEGDNEEARPNVPFYVVIDGVAYGPDADATVPVYGDANQNPLFDNENMWGVPLGYKYVIGVVKDVIDGNYYLQISRGGFVGLDELNAGKTVANVRYFNMAGQEMQQADGICIIVTIFTDGSTNAVKVMK